jgi:CheY-like chemotaxis protein
MNSESRRCTIAEDGYRRAAHRLAALVVDDDEVMRRLATTMLRNIGFSVRTASEGSQALLDFKLAPCDLVLTDYEMPAINGYQLGCEIKSQNPSTCVVIMTGSSRAAVKGLMSNGGIDGWLFKPFYWAELKNLLERAGLHPKG